MKVFIKPTQENEAMQLCNIQKAAFFPLYEKYHDEGNPCLRGVEDITKKLESEYFRCFTVFLDDEIVGGIVYKCKGKTPFFEKLEMGQYYLQRVYVHPDHQCKKIAQTAIMMCEKELKDASHFIVDFPEDLEKNRRCYEKCGFIDTGKRLEIQSGLTLACLVKQVD